MLALNLIGDSLKVVRKERDRARRKASAIAWRLANPEKVAAQVQRLTDRRRNGDISDYEAKRAEYSKAHRHRRYARVDEFKQGKPCADCGRYFPPICMDFDHRDHHSKEVKSNMGMKTFAASHSEEEFLEEVDKCDLVCACCHRLRTQAIQQEISDKAQFTRRIRQGTR